jgi:hypothetical protein
MEPQPFDKEALRRLPLANAVLLLFRWIGDAVLLDDLFERHRGACYTDVLTFPVFSQVIASALLEHRGSLRQSATRRREADELPVSVASVYGKLRRLPPAVSEAFLAEGSARLLSVVPARDTPLPASLEGFAVVIVDGKVVKRVPKRLKPLRHAAGGVLGGKALVALDLASGLALALATSPDGDTNEARLVPALLPQVRLRRSNILWVADRQFCDLTQPRAFTERDGDHFLVRYHPRSKFCPDPSQPSQGGTDSEGRTYVQDRGWLGAAGNKDRRYVRRITLSRPGQEDVILITDLLDEAVYPAGDLLALYLMRWGIERVFQQITEVFDLQHLIGTTPQGTLFQLAFCLQLYNVVQVVRAYVAAGAMAQGASDLQGQPLTSAAVSPELLYVDVRRQLVALYEVVDASRVVPLIGGVLTAAELSEQLHRLLHDVWTPRWRKSPPKKKQPPPKKPTRRTHHSAHRLIEQARSKKDQEGSKSC